MAEHIQRHAFDDSEESAWLRNYLRVQVLALGYAIDSQAVSKLPPAVQQTVGEEDLARLAKAQLDCIARIVQGNRRFCDVAQIHYLFQAVVRWMASYFAGRAGLCEEAVGILEEIESRGTLGPKEQP